MQKRQACLYGKSEKIYKYAVHFGKRGKHAEESAHFPIEKNGKFMYNNLCVAGHLPKERKMKMEFLLLAGGLVIILIAVIIAVVSSVVSAVAADQDDGEE